VEGDGGEGGELGLRLGCAWQKRLLALVAPVLNEAAFLVEAG
jgi:hypothetical protein